MLENIEFEGLPFDFKIMSHPRQYAKEAKINVLCVCFFYLFIVNELMFFFSLIFMFQQILQLL